MDILLGFLVQSIESIDGRKGSARFYIEASIAFEIQRREKKITHNKRVMRKRAKILEKGPLASDEEFDDSLQLQRLNEAEKQQIREEKTAEIYRQTMFKYKMMRIRSKIGYQSFKKRKTISELLISQILRSYN
jgi:hypothetical protein